MRRARVLGMLLPLLLVAGGAHALEAPASPYPLEVDPYPPRPHAPFHVRYWAPENATPTAGTLRVCYADDKGTITQCLLPIAMAPETEERRALAASVTMDLPPRQRIGFNVTWTDASGTIHQHPGGAEGYVLVRAADAASPPFLGLPLPAWLALVGALAAASATFKKRAWG